MTWVWVSVAAAVIGAAAWIIIARVKRFIETRGRSGCENCPYSNGCAGACHRPPRKRGKS